MTPRLQVVSPDASPEEIAAIVAAVSMSLAAASADAVRPNTLSEWVRGTRLGARRAGLQRGPWRLSGRIGRRARA